MQSVAARPCQRARSGRIESGRAGGSGDSAHGEQDAPAYGTPIRPTEPRARLGDTHAAGDLAVALPISQLVGDRRVVRSRLDAPLCVEGPGGNTVLASL